MPVTDVVAVFSVFRARFAGSAAVTLTVVVFSSPFRHLRVV
jgi:hypothetical protein